MSTATSRFTLLDDALTHELTATLDGTQVRLAADDVRATLGWTLEERGLCRGDVCIPVRDGAQDLRRDGIDLDELARLLGRPLALDVPARCAALGTAASERAAGLASLEAPDFTLPDLDGRLHSLRDQRGKKVLLVAYASW